MKKIWGRGYEGGRNYYSGAWLVTEDGNACYRVKHGGNAGFILEPSQDLSQIESDFPPGSTFLIYDVGPGDPVQVLNYCTVVF